LNVSDRYNVSVDWLLNGTGDMMLGETRSPSKKNVRVPKSPCSGYNVAVVPFVLTSTTVEAGSYLDAYFDDEAGSVPLPSDWLRKIVGVDSANLCVMEVDSESMAPTLSPGELAIIDFTAHSYAFRDGVWVIRHDGVLFIQRAQRIGHDYRFICDNPSYLPLHWNGSEELMGRVVGSVKRF